ncbi:hypothetical protein BD779DRAFT_1175919 [Infundibulicybe gibba]|nr:hypothetical protein BD779DRAFT_1175919 [Infundibulicybe gibba]
MCRSQQCYPAQTKGSVLKSMLKPASSLKDTPTAQRPKYTYNYYSNPRPCFAHTQHEGEMDDLVNFCTRTLAFDME